MHASAVHHDHIAPSASSASALLVYDCDRDGPGVVIHLIAEFRAIAGVTPRALLGELRAAPSIG